MAKNDLCLETALAKFRPYFLPQIQIQITERFMSSSVKDLQCGAD